LMDTIGNDAITAAAKASPLQATYGQTDDRPSAFEMLAAKAAQEAPAAPSLPPPLPPQVSDGGLASASGQARGRSSDSEGSSVVQEVLQSSAFKSFLRSAATVAGREITRSVFGTSSRRRR
jgi:uncharacterized protein